MIVSPVSIHSEPAAVGRRDISRKVRSEIYKVRSRDCFQIHCQLFFSILFIMWWSLPYLLLSASNGVAVESAAASNDTNLHNHDSTFTPDFYLSVTYENHAVACQHRMSVLVNGTSPGPTLRLPPGKTSWVRVCNNMDIYNTTMVLQPFRPTFISILTCSSTGMASLSAPHLSATVHLFPNGPLHRINASTTRSTLNLKMPGRTFTTLTSASRP